MIDTVQTLKNLHDAFPRFKLETLLKILDCVEETLSYYQTGIQLDPKRGHLQDKTSKAIHVLGENLPDDNEYTE